MVYSGAEIMARPENIELQNAIVSAASTLFMEKGYAKVSYADIASAAGTTKGLVQYYFKKKEELATAVMEQVLSDSIQELGYSAEDEDGGLETYSHLYKIGQKFFTYFMSTPGSRLFLRDIVGDMKLTDSVLSFNLNWAMQYGKQADRVNDAEVSESVIVSMGGFYALLYHCLTRGLDFDIAKNLHRVMLSVMLALGFEEKQSIKALKN